MDVRVSAKNGKGPIEWELNGKKPKDSKLEFPKDSGPDKVEFKLDDDTDRGLKFDRTAPFWDHISTADDCPPAGARSDQTQVLDCEDKKLTVRNENSKECTVHYQLNFLDSEGKAHRVDPEFKNGGNT